jgi:putative endonuclease
VLYTGIAKDVEARFQAHLKGAGAKFMRLRPPLRIVGRVRMATKSEALRAEYALKRLSPAQKLRWLLHPSERESDQSRGDQSGAGEV